MPGGTVSYNGSYSGLDCCRLTTSQPRRGLAGGVRRAPARARRRRREVRPCARRPRRRDQESRAAERRGGRGLGAIARLLRRLGADGASATAPRPRRRRRAGTARGGFRGPSSRTFHGLGASLRVAWPRRGRAGSRRGRRGRASSHSMSRGIPFARVFASRSSSTSASIPVCSR